MTNFEKIQKAALARLETGENLEHILQDYADYEEELRPILEEAAGLSLSSLMQRPKAPVVKQKAKNAQASNIFLPVLIGVVVLLAGGIFYLLNMQPTVIAIPEPIEVTPIIPTEAPTIISQIVEVEDSNCQSLGQLNANARSNQEQQELIYSATGSVTDPRAVDDTSTSSGSGTGSSSTGVVAMATASPMGTAMPPMEPIVDASSSGSTGAGGGASSPDIGGGDGASAPMPMDSTTTTTTELERSEPVEDIAVVSGGAPIVATSVMSYDESESDADFAVDGERAASMAEESTAMDISVNNQAALQPLNAGEIDDNADWDTYQEYRRNFLTQSFMTYAVKDVDTTDRQIISVVDSSGLPVLGACVQIYYGESFITASSTYATGLTMFFPNLSESTRYRENFRIVVSKAGLSAEASLDRSTIGGLTTVTLPLNQAQQNIQLDVMFLLDATGSMSDEIQQLQSNILSISAQLDAMPNNVDVRFGLVAYRDREEEYVTRVYDFTDDVELFQANLMTVVADGGGDYPESLNEGFDDALNAVTWRGEDTIKLVFLVADAPPHIDYVNDSDYTLLMQDALARGIKVHPIASSGLQPEGEFILRQIGQFTMGRFLFLTYDGGVAGTTGEDRPDLDVGDARDEQGIGDYSVDQLDELVLRLITDEIAMLQGQ
jgi:hypothetical protein